MIMVIAFTVKPFDKFSVFDSRQSSTLYKEAVGIGIHIELSRREGVLPIRKRAPVWSSKFAV